MSKVTTGATMSLDGYIAGPDDSHFDLLFRWYNNGDVPVDLGGLPVSMTAEDAEYLRSLVERTGASSTRGATAHLAIWWLRRIARIGRPSQRPWFVSAAGPFSKSPRASR